MISCFLKLILRAYSAFSIFILAASRKTVAVYSIDRVDGAGKIDPRQELIYSSLCATNRSFFEFFHVSSLRNSFGNLFVRCRLSSFFEFSSQAELVKIFKTAKFEKLLSIDDYRHTAPLILAARDAGIESIAVQHGCYFSKEMFPMEGIVCFDKVIVWSDFFATRLLSFCPKQTTIVCSHPQENFLIEGRNFAEVSVLVIEEAVEDAELLESFLAALILLKDISLKLRLRPGAKEVSSPYRKFFAKEQLVSSLDIFDDLAASTVVIGSYSSVLYQALLVGSGVVICQRGKFAADLLDCSVGQFVKSPSEISRAVFKEANLTLLERNSRREKIWGSSEVKIRFEEVIL